MIDDLYMVISVVEYEDKEKFGNKKSESQEEGGGPGFRGIGCY